MTVRLQRKSGFDERKAPKAPRPRHGDRGPGCPGGPGGPGVSTPFWGYRALPSSGAPALRSGPARESQAEAETFRTKTTENAYWDLIMTGSYTFHIQQSSLAA